MAFSTQASASSSYSQAFTDIQLNQQVQPIFDISTYAQAFLDTKLKQLTLSQIEPFLEKNFGNFQQNLEKLTRGKPPDLIDYELYLRVCHATLRHVKSEVELLFYFASSTFDGFTSAQRFGVVYSNFAGKSYKQVKKCWEALRIEDLTIDLETAKKWVSLVRTLK
ncbi:hypothetical protein SS50377_22807 [Spironucleus salmonicida]|uniref:Uncharacterized protein n=1 Tax=Spironucleus salmonicida TaxID=348837 RepID=V6LCY6_9EUKA|nr:hypothetical protein SS50377_22807 [Spironucleus salmonicida]|eukprot:EST42317.1 Hypothetical protein SS50377_18187 [Spironucleus salmonicida]